MQMIEKKGMHPCFRSESWNFRWSKFDRFICSIFIVRELHVYNNNCLTIFIPLVIAVS